MLPSTSSPFLTATLLLSALIATGPAMATESVLPSQDALNRASVRDYVGPARRVRIDVGRGATQIDATVGVPFRLSATADLAGGQTRRVEDRVTWTSSDPTVLRISDGSDGYPAGHAMPMRRGRVGVAITYPKLDGLPVDRVPELVGDSIMVVVREAG